MCCSRWHDRANPEQTRKGSRGQAPPAFLACISDKAAWEEEAASHLPSMRGIWGRTGLEAGMVPNELCATYDILPISIRTIPGSWIACCDCCILLILASVAPQFDRIPRLSGALRAVDLRVHRESVAVRLRYFHG